MVFDGQGSVAEYESVDHELLIDGMGVILNTPWPGARMGKEPYLRRGLGMILLPGLNDLRAVLLKQARGTMRRPYDRNMSGSMWVGTLENYYYQAPTVRLRLRLNSFPQLPPSTLLARRRTKPFRLRIGKQNLAVFRWPQHVYSEPLFNRGCERAAMCRPAGSRVVCSLVRFTRLPVYVFMREPQRLDIHAIQHRQEPLALRGNRSTTRRFGGDGRTNCPYQEQQHEDQESSFRS